MMYLKKVYFDEVYLMKWYIMSLDEVYLVYLYEVYLVYLDNMYLVYRDEVYLTLFWYLTLFL